MTPAALLPVGADARQGDREQMVVDRGEPDVIAIALAAARDHLKVDVAAVTELADGRHVCRFVDGDERALGLEASMGRNLGTYVRVPLKLSDGRLYGSLSFVRTAPRPSQPKRDADVIGALARIIAQELERREAEMVERRRVIERIERVLAEERLAMVFQPIVDLRTGEVAGFEALGRFMLRPRRGPEVWFAEAGEVGLGAALEIAAIRTAVSHLADLPGQAYMSLNVSPQMARAPELAAMLSELPADRLAIELTEHARITDYPALSEALTGLRARGVRLMIDDVGAGFASLHHILRLAPDAIKLDRSLTSGIEADPARRALAAALVTFAREIGATIIAEGIETEDELAALQALGVERGQGFHLGRPRPISAAFHEHPGSLGSRLPAPA